MAELNLTVQWDTIYGDNYASVSDASLLAADIVTVRDITDRFWMANNDTFLTRIKDLYDGQGASPYPIIAWHVRNYRCETRGADIAADSSYVTPRWGTDYPMPEVDMYATSPVYSYDRDIVNLLEDTHSFTLSSRYSPWLHPSWAIPVQLRTFKATSLGDYWEGAWMDFTKKTWLYHWAKYIVEAVEDVRTSTWGSPFTHAIALTAWKGWWYYDNTATSVTPYGAFDSDAGFFNWITNSWNPTTRDYPGGNNTFSRLDHPHWEAKDHLWGWAEGYQQLRRAMNHSNIAVANQPLLIASITDNLSKQFLYNNSIAVNLDTEDAADDYEVAQIRRIIEPCDYVHWQDGSAATRVAAAKTWAIARKTLWQDAQGI